MSIRIALHAGPVFAASDPFTGRPNYYGTHVNRTARMEPVTVPGHVYASQPFLGCLLAEMRQNGETEPPCQWEYIGVLSLAKKFGSAPAYYLYDSVSDPICEPDIASAGDSIQKASGN